MDKPDSTIATLPDIVQRLRGPIAHSFTNPRDEQAIKDCLAASQEIEDLRDEVKRLRQSRDAWADEFRKMTEHRDSAVADCKALEEQLHRAIDKIIALGGEW